MLPPRGERDPASALRIIARRRNRLTVEFHDNGSVFGIAAFPRSPLIATSLRYVEEKIARRDAHSLYPGCTSGVSDLARFRRE